MNKDSLTGFGIGLLAGALVGGVVALLCAPKSGEETRAMIREKAENVADKVKSKFHKDTLDDIKPK